MRLRRHQALRLLLATLSAFAADSIANHASTVLASSLLIQYERGDDSASSRVAVGTVSEIRAVRREVQIAKTVSPRVRAAFLLEAAHFAHLQMYGWPTEQVLAIRDLLEDACELVRNIDPADPFVRRWHLAALAVISQSHDVRLLEHLPHSVGHVGEGSIVLVRAIHQEATVWHGIYQTLPSLKGDLPNPGVDFRLSALSRARIADATKQTNEMLREAATFPETKAEALLRLGALADASGASQQAIETFENVERLTNDDWLLYLAHLLKGRALSRAKRYIDAEASFKRAIAIRPNARSAQLALTAVLYARGTPASEELLRALEAGADEPDPWAQYENGDYRFWPARVAQMREAMR